MNFGLSESEAQQIILPKWEVIKRHSAYNFLVRSDKVEKAIFRESSEEIIERMKQLSSLGYTPKVLWSRDKYVIREWIDGTNWKVYIDDVPLTRELALWYIEENYKIWKETGGHGDLIWYNILITPDKKVKWIDINSGGESIFTFSRQMCWHTYKMFTPEEVIELTKTFK